MRPARPDLSRDAGRGPRSHPGRHAVGASDPEDRRTSPSRASGSRRRSPTHEASRAQHGGRARCCSRPGPVAEPLNVAIVHSPRARPGARCDGSRRGAASSRRPGPRSRDVASRRAASAPSADSQPRDRRRGSGVIDLVDRRAPGPLERLAPDVVLVVSDPRVRHASRPGRGPRSSTTSTAWPAATPTGLEVLGGRGASATPCRPVPARRSERRLRSRAMRTVAAGWADAHRLEAEWVPIVVDPADPCHGAGPARRPLRRDTALPAEHRRARAAGVALAPRWRRPQTSALIAGGGSASPSARPRTVERVGRRRATSRRFPRWPPARRVAVAPLARTAGIQIKVLDAASLGLPQVVTTPPWPASRRASLCCRSTTTTGSPSRSSASSTTLPGLEVQAERLPHLCRGRVRRRPLGGMGQAAAAGLTQGSAPVKVLRMIATSDGRIARRPKTSTA